MTYEDKRKNRQWRQSGQLLWANEVIFHFPPEYGTLAYLDGVSFRVKHIPLLQQFHWKNQ